MGRENDSEEELSKGNDENNEVEVVEQDEQPQVEEGDNLSVATENSENDPYSEEDKVMAEKNIDAWFGRGTPKGGARRSFRNQTLPKGTEEAHKKREEEQVAGNAEALYHSLQALGKLKAIPFEVQWSRADKIEKNSYLAALAQYVRIIFKKKLITQKGLPLQIFNANNAAKKLHPALITLDELERELETLLPSEGLGASVDELKDHFIKNPKALSAYRALESDLKKGVQEANKTLEYLKGLNFPKITSGAKAIAKQPLAKNKTVSERKNSIEKNLEKAKAAFKREASKRVTRSSTKPKVLQWKNALLAIRPEDTDFRPKLGSFLLQQNVKEEEIRDLVGPCMDNYITNRTPAELQASLKKHPNFKSFRQHVEARKDLEVLVDILLYLKDETNEETFKAGLRKCFDFEDKVEQEAFLSFVWEKREEGKDFRTYNSDDELYKESEEQKTLKALQPEKPAVTKKQKAKEKLESWEKDLLGLIEYKDEKEFNEKLESFFTQYYDANALNAKKKQNALKYYIQNRTPEELKKSMEQRIVRASRSSNVPRAFIRPIEKRMKAEALMYFLQTSDEQRVRNFVNLEAYGTPMQENIDRIVTHMMKNYQGDEAKLLKFNSPKALLNHVNERIEVEELVSSLQEGEKENVNKLVRRVRNRSAKKIVAYMMENYQGEKAEVLLKFKDIGELSMSINQERKRKKESSKKAEAVKNSGNVSGMPLEGFGKAQNVKSGTGKRSTLSKALSFGRNKKRRGSNSQGGVKKTTGGSVG